MRKAFLAAQVAAAERLRATGRAAHSSLPEQGESAIDKLLDALVHLHTLPLPSDPDLGSTFYTIGLIEGGVAPNVVSPHASAEVMFRTIGSADDLLTLLEQLQPLVTIEEVLRVSPIRMHTVPGFSTRVFSFATDVPFLDRWGVPLLFGPGSILVAHTDGEFVSLDELNGAVDAYERLARGCDRWRSSLAAVVAHASSRRRSADRIRPD